MRQQWLYRSPLGEGGHGRALMRGRQDSVADEARPRASITWLQLEPALHVNVFGVVGVVGVVGRDLEPTWRRTDAVPDGGLGEPPWQPAPVRAGSTRDLCGLADCAGAGNVICRQRRRGVPHEQSRIGDL